MDGGFLRGIRGGRRGALLSREAEEATTCNRIGSELRRGENGVIGRREGRRLSLGFLDILIHPSPLSLSPIGSALD